MATATLKTGKSGEIWSRAIQFDKELSPTAARALLQIRLSEGDRNRMHELSAKARDGNLSDQEKIEIETYEQLGCVMDILHSKARRALKQRRPTS